MKLAAKTDIGNQRNENQDNYRAGYQKNDTVWALVCDGMGGANGGKIASGIVAASLEELFVENIDAMETPIAVRKFLLNSLDATNNIVFERAAATPALSGMGTTIVCAVVRGGRVQYAHVGDSRIYLLHSGELKQLTRDHSMVQELLEQGSITPQEATHHPKKNLITRALGVAVGVGIDYDECPVVEGDILLLCTDGLSNYVTDSEMTDVLQTQSFYEAPNVLVQKALDAGGLDNITVLLVKVEPVEG